MAQGEYIAPEKITNVLLTAPGVAEVFVYGDSTESFLVSIVVPDPEFVKNFGKTLDPPISDISYLCQMPDLSKKILANMKECSKKNGLNSLETVKACYLESTSFVLLELCTNTLKVQRHAAKKHYEAVIKKLYADN